MNITPPDNITQPSADSNICFADLSHLKVYYIFLVGWQLGALLMYILDASTIALPFLLTMQSAFILIVAPLTFLNMPKTKVVQVFTTIMRFLGELVNRWALDEEYVSEKLAICGRIFYIVDASQTTMACS